MPSPRHRTNRSFWRSGYVLCFIAFLAAVSYFAMPSILLGDAYEPTIQVKGEHRLNGERVPSASAVQDVPDKLMHTSFSRKDLSVVDGAPLLAQAAPTPAYSQEVIRAGTRPVSIMAIISRYHDDLRWLIDPNTGVMHNSTGTPQFILPIKIYQASDIDPEGFPSFPGFLPPAPANISAANYTQSELLAMNYSASGPLQMFPTWPEWAWRYVVEKNKTKEKVRPGSVEEAEFLVRKRLGLPRDGQGPSDYQGWRDYEHLFDENYSTRNSLANQNKNSLPSSSSSSNNDGDRSLSPTDASIDAATIDAATIDSATILQKFTAENRSEVVIIPDISPVLPLHIMPNRGGESMAYISGIIDHYDNLPDFMVFLHGHRLAWHTPLLSQDWILRRLATHPPLDLNLSSTNGYHALGCLERWGNDISQLFPTNIDANWKSNNGPRWHEALAARFAQAWREHLGDAYGMPLPDYVRVPTAATFIATREAIKRRPKEFYIGVRDWMLETKIENKWLGIVMEFQIGIMFANKTHFSVSQEQCLCEVYTICSSPAEL